MGWQENVYVFLDQTFLYPINYTYDVPYFERRAGRWLGNQITGPYTRWDLVLRVILDYEKNYYNIYSEQIVGVFLFVQRWKNIFQTQIILSYYSSNLFSITFVLRLIIILLLYHTQYYLSILFYVNNYILVLITWYEFMFLILFDF